MVYTVRSKSRSDQQELSMSSNVQIDNTSQNVDFLKNVSFSATASKLPKID